MVFRISCFPFSFPISIADAVPTAMIPAETKADVIDQFSRKAAMTTMTANGIKNSIPSSTANRMTALPCSFFKLPFNVPKNPLRNSLNKNPKSRPIIAPNTMLYKFNLSNGFEKALIPIPIKQSLRNRFFSAFPFLFCSVISSTPSQIAKQRPG